MASRAIGAVLVVCAIGLLAQRPSVAEQIGPLELSGDLDGAPYRIRVPAQWNGTLLVFVHGYRDKADHPGARRAAVGPDRLW